MKLKGFTHSGSSQSSKTADMDDQIQEAVTDAIKGSNDKVVEIRPANTSKGRRKFPWILLIGGVFAVSYWLRKSQKPADKVQQMASETADQTKQMADQAAQTIEESGEAMAERIEDGSQKASEQVQQTGENAAEQAEQAGEKAAEKAQQSGSSSSGNSSS